MIRELFNLTGHVCGRVVPLIDKYGINFPAKVCEEDKIRLINQLWKLVPMREHGEDWERHLYTVIEELTGLVKINKERVEGLILLSKLEGLTSDECADFMLYRRTVFKCIDLLSRLIDNG